MDNYEAPLELNNAMIIGINRSVRLYLPSPDLLDVCTRARLSSPIHNIQGVQIQMQPVLCTPR